jgi:Ca-activated chloride channel family protein
MRFAHPEFLWLLAALPLLWLLKGRGGISAALLFPNATLASTLPRGIRPGRAGRPFLLRLLALALLILAMARPQLGRTSTEIQASGIDIMLAVDVSGSMEAMDFTLEGQAVNRLEVVKRVVDRFIEARPNDRIGIVAFGGRPYLVSPLTLDHDWLRSRLDSLQIGMVEDGTAIGSAIGTATNRLRDQPSTSRLLILLTDGINNAGTVPPVIAAQAAEALKIKIYTIGAGTRGEAPVPVLDAFGRRRLIHALVDIDEQTLNRVAEMTGARYFRATDTESLEKVYDDINSMETTTRVMKRFESTRELFLVCIVAALFTMAGEILITGRRLP